MIDPSGGFEPISPDEKTPGILTDSGGLKLVAGTGFNTVETGRIAVLLPWAA